MGASARLQRTDRALRLYLFLPAAKKGYRFNPLRVPKSGILPDFGIGVCLRQTPSIRRWRIAMETAASMPPAAPKSGLPRRAANMRLSRNSGNDCTVPWRFTAKSKKSNK
jgi:hypothetical protein